VVQHEVITIFPWRGDDDEMHPMLHKSADEVHVARETIESRDDQRIPRRPRFLQCCPQLGAKLKRIRSPARLGRPGATT